MNPLMIHQAMLKSWSYSVTLTTQPMAIWPGRTLHILYSQGKKNEGQTVSIKSELCTLKYTYMPYVMVSVLLS